MKKTIKTAVLLCLTVFVLLSAVSCNGGLPFETFETTTGTETPDATTPQETPAEPEQITPEETTPESTTPEITTPEVTTPEETTPEVTTPEETTPEEPDYDLPEKIDMQGYTYKAYVRKFAGTDPDALHAQIMNGNNRYECIDFWVDETTSGRDAISAAVYRRNSQIETDYNCKIQQIASNGSQIEHLVNSYTNFEGYDLTIIMAKAAAQAATQNLLRNLKDMTYVDLSHEAFDQNSINELSVADKLYFLSGDMNISTMEVAGFTIVNLDFYDLLAETIVETFDKDPTYSDIYNIVKANKWTMDTMMTIAELANVDAGVDGGELHVLPHGTNKDGTIVDNKYSGGDIVGYHQYLYSGLWYFYGSGGRITAKNDEGLPEVVFGSDTAETLYNYIFDKFNRKINAPWIPQEAYAILNMNFLTGYVLFADMSLFNIRTEIYTTADFEYGILPTPVYEEGKDYRSVVHFNNWAHLWAIPSLTNNTEYAERMMQIMATYSSLPDSTMSAYYDRTVCFITSSENKSREVLDIIRTSLVYDMALLYPSWGGIETILSRIPNREAPEYAGIKDGLEFSIDEMEFTIERLLNPGAEY